MFRTRRAFTLIELLVVIAIIAILIALLVPAVQKVRSAAARSQYQNNLKQFGVALHAYHDVNKFFPNGGIVPTSGGGYGLSYLYFLLPYIEQQTMFNTMDPKVKFDTAPNANMAITPVPIFLCPEAANVNTRSESESTGSTKNYTTHYYGVAGPLGTNPVNGQAYTTIATGNGQGNMASQGLLYGGSNNRMGDVTDGTSNSFAVAEMSWYFTPGSNNGYRTWSRGWDGGTTSVNATVKSVNFAINLVSYIPTTNFNVMSFGSNHGGGCNFLMVDGTVRYVNDVIDMTTYKSLSSIRGADVVSNY